MENKKKKIFCLELGKKHTFWHWEWGRISAPKLGDREPCKINDFPTWDPNTSLSFLFSIVGMSTEIKMEEAMSLPNNTYQDHNLKLGVKKN